MGAKSKPHPRGGLYVEDLVAGPSFDHRLTQMDNMLFSNMTLNQQPLHIDAHLCATETRWGRPLMTSLFKVWLKIGISVNGATRETSIANLWMIAVRFPAPRFEGDVIRCMSCALSKRESHSWPGASGSPS